MSGPDSVQVIFDTIGSVSSVALSVIAYMWTQYYQRNAIREANRRALENAVKELDRDMFCRLIGAMLYISPDNHIEA